MSHFFAIAAGVIFGRLLIDSMVKRGASAADLLAVAGFFILIAVGIELVS